MITFSYKCVGHCVSCGQSLRMMKPEELQVSLLFYCSVGHFFMSNVRTFYLFG